MLGETLTDYMAPYVVSFSSRGPNPITPDILKVLIKKKKRIGKRLI